MATYHRARGELLVHYRAMNHVAQRMEVNRNYDAFQRVLASILDEHKNQFALMRDGQIVDFLDNPGAADRAGHDRFADQIYSIQEVTNEPIDLGIYSHFAS